MRVEAHMSPQSKWRLRGLDDSTRACISGVKLYAANPTGRRAETRPRSQHRYHVKRWGVVQTQMVLGGACFCHLGGVRREVAGEYGFGLWRYGRATKHSDCLQYTHAQQ
ncbi:hypothetical protein BDZ89DRAFT_1071502 [Hymenopellis radicata]|nr:hypothetical protein BDZ89DRAFT_1071502 [Hymenopellis radicata]